MEWVHSADSEFDGLTDTGVVDHNYTDQMLIDAGVEPNPETGKIKPIPLSVVLDHKYIDGILDCQTEDTDGSRWSQWKYAERNTL